MSKYFRFVLIIFLIIICWFFYKKYFEQPKIVKNSKKSIENKNFEESVNNKLLNLKYKINIEDNTYYEISATESELSIEDSAEVIKMKNVEAIISINDYNFPINIYSDYATFNSSSYYSEFRENVTITYLNNKIISDKAEISIQDKVIKIYDDVKFMNENSNLTTDAIEIDLITNNINLYMINEKNKVKLDFVN